nr:MAG TPA: hypothetical protein [Caudoviricetes sp.]
MRHASKPPHKKPVCGYSNRKRVFCQGLQPDAALVPYMLGAIRCPLSLGIGQRLGAVLTVDNALARLTPSGSFDIMRSKSHAVGFEVCGCAGVLGIQRVKIILRAGTDTKPTDVGKATLKFAAPFINILPRSLYLGEPGDCGDLRLALCFGATLGLKLGSEDGDDLGLCSDNGIKIAVAFGSDTAGDVKPPIGDVLPVNPFRRESDIVFFYKLLCVHL